MNMLGTCLFLESLRPRRTNSYRATNPEPSLAHPNFKIEVLIKSTRGVWFLQASEVSGRILTSQFLPYLRFGASPGHRGASRQRKLNLMGSWLQIPRETRGTRSRRHSLPLAVVPKLLNLVGPNLCEVNWIPRSIACLAHWESQVGIFHVGVSFSTTIGTWVGIQNHDSSLFIKFIRKFKWRQSLEWWSHEWVLSNGIV
jgi:hypothetical protein